MEYVYIVGKHFARVDGYLDIGIGKNYFYQTEHLGSTVAVTDEQGKQVSKERELDHVAKFTGRGTL